MVEVQVVDIVMIQIDAEIQPRERLLPEPLRALTQLIKEDGAEAVPPVVLFHDTEDMYWLADGHYRVTAAKEALKNGGPSVLRAEIHEGTKRDAIYFAAGANKHGTQLTNEEKRRVVERLLRDTELNMSDNAIARHVGISNSFVSRIHNELRDLNSQEESLLQPKIPPPRNTTYVRGGKEITIRSDKIGRRKKAKAEATATPPASPAIIQDERPTDQDEAPKVDDSADLQPSVTETEEEELDDLGKAWIAATAGERKYFIAWILERSANDLGLDTLPDDTLRIRDVI